MSHTTTPISASSFRIAIRDLPPSSLRLKLAELQNSIAHLDYSNEQLRPFAEGSATGAAPAASPDQDCIDAIGENEAVIARFQQRIAMLREEIGARAGGAHLLGDSDPVPPPIATAANDDHNPWTDGTFTTGRIGGGLLVDGQGGEEETIPASLGSTARVNGTAATTAGGVTSVPAEARNARAVGREGGGRLDDEALRRAVEEQLRLQDEADEDDISVGMHL